MRHAVAFACIMALGLLAGCSTSVSPNSAVVRGLLVWPLDSQPNLLHPVHIVGTVKVLQGSKVVATVTTGKAGEFTARVPQGTYRLEGFPSSKMPPAVCDSRNVVQATANTSTTANVDCHFANGYAPGLTL